MEKVKNVLGMGSEEQRTTTEGAHTTGATGMHTSAGPGAGYEGQQFTTTQPAGQYTTTTTTQRAGEHAAGERGVAHWETEGRRGEQRVGVQEVCRQEFYTRVEDRPVIKERVERLVEHHPVASFYYFESLL
jgi:hypothetical protein